MKHFLKKILPSPEYVQKHKVLRPVASWLFNPYTWHFNRRAIALAVAVGVFFGSLPIIGQMVLAAVVAVLLRVNVPVVMVATTISNPLTIPFFYTANYYIGVWLLGRPIVHLNEIDWTINGLISLGGNILVPLYFGSLGVGVMLAFVAFILTRILWRIHIVSRWRKRKHSNSRR